MTTQAIVFDRTVFFRKEREALTGLIQPLGLSVEFTKSGRGREYAHITGGDGELLFAIGKNFSGFVAYGPNGRKVAHAKAVGELVAGLPLD